MDCGVNGNTLTVRFNRALNTAVDLSALPVYFSVRGITTVDGGNRNFDLHPSEISWSGTANRNLETKLIRPARPGDQVSLTYHRIANVGLLYGAGASGKMAPGFVEYPATNNTPGANRPVPLRASVTDNRLEVVFDQALNESSTPAGSSFLVNTSDVDDDHRQIRGTGVTTVSGSTVSVKLAWEVRVDEIASVSYTRPDYAPLESADGLAVLSINQFKIALVYDGKKPTRVQQAAVQTRTSPAQSKIVLYYDEALDTSSVPAADDFEISDELNTLIFPTPSVSVLGNAVVLTLDMLLPDSRVLSVTYTPGTNPVRDLAGNAAGWDRIIGFLSSTAGKPRRVSQGFVDGAHVGLAVVQDLYPVATPVDAFKIHHTLLEGQTDADLAEFGGIAAFISAARGIFLLLKHPVYPCAGEYPFTLTYTKPTAAGAPPSPGYRWQRDGRLQQGTHL